MSTTLYGVCIVPAPALSTFKTNAAALTSRIVCIFERDAANHRGQMAEAKTPKGTRPTNSSNVILQNHGVTANQTRSQKAWGFVRVLHTSSNHPPATLLLLTSTTSHLNRMVIMQAERYPDAHSSRGHARLNSSQTCDLPFVAVVIHTWVHARYTQKREVVFEVSHVPLDLLILPLYAHLFASPRPFICISSLPQHCTIVNTPERPHP